MACRIVQLIVTGREPVPIQQHKVHIGVCYIGMALLIGLRDGDAVAIPFHQQGFLPRPFQTQAPAFAGNDLRRDLFQKPVVFLLCLLLQNLLHLTGRFRLHGNLLLKKRVLYQRIGFYPPGAVYTVYSIHGFFQVEPRDAHGLLVAGGKMLLPYVADLDPCLPGHHNAYGVSFHFPDGFRDIGSCCLHDIVAKLVQQRIQLLGIVHLIVKDHPVFCRVVFSPHRRRQVGFLYRQPLLLDIFPQGLIHGWMLFRGMLCMAYQVIVLGRTVGRSNIKSIPPLEFGVILCL